MYFIPLGDFNKSYEIAEKKMTENKCILHP